MKSLPPRLLKIIWSTHHLPEVRCMSDRRRDTLVAWNVDSGGRRGGGWRRDRIPDLEREQIVDVNNRVSTGWEAQQQRFAASAEARVTGP